jgi:hypothetical protein
MYFGLPYPEPLIRGMNPDPTPVLLSPRKNSKQNLDSYCFVTSFLTFYFLKNDVNGPSKRNKQKNFYKIIFSLKVNDENNRIRIHTKKMSRIRKTVWEFTFLALLPGVCHSAQHCCSPLYMLVPT